MVPKFVKISAYKEPKEHWRVRNDKAQARREAKDIYKYGPVPNIYYAHGYDDDKHRVIYYIELGHARIIDGHRLTPGGVEPTIETVHQHPRTDSILRKCKGFREHLIAHSPYHPLPTIPGYCRPPQYVEGHWEFIRAASQFSCLFNCLITIEGSKKTQDMMEYREETWEKICKLRADADELMVDRTINKLENPVDRFYTNVALGEPTLAYVAKKLGHSLAIICVDNTANEQIHTRWGVGSNPHLFPPIFVATFGGHWYCAFLWKKEQNLTPGIPWLPWTLHHMSWDKFHARFTQQYGVTCTLTRFQRVCVWVRGHLLLGLRVDSGHIDQLIAICLCWTNATDGLASWANGMKNLPPFKTHPELKVFESLEALNTAVRIDSKTRQMVEQLDNFIVAIRQALVKRLRNRMEAGTLSFVDQFAK